MQEQRVGKRALILLELLVYILFVLLISNCLQDKQNIQPKETTNLQANESSKELANLYQEDQRDRMASMKGYELAKKDLYRLSRVKDIYQKNLIVTPEDQFHAGMIFHHGRELADYETARDLFFKAAKMGYEDAKWCYAAAADRCLMMQGKPQRYGTQFSVKKDGSWELYPVDPSTTDDERAQWDVPPLDVCKECARLKQSTSAFRPSLNKK